MFKYESKLGQVKDGDGAVLTVVSSTDWDFGADITKPFSATCWSNTSGTCINLTDANDYVVPQGFANILAAMVEVDRRTTNNQIERNGHDDPIIGYYDGRGDGSSCTTGQGSSWGYNSFCVVDTAADDNHVVAHEIGHLVHRRQINYSGPLADCPSYDWIGSTTNEEKCAVSEGWADFFAGAVYFPESATAPVFRMSSRELEGDTSQGNSSALRCADMSGNPEDEEANVARFFWDVFDSTTLGDDGNDNSDESFATMTLVWDNFADTYPALYNNRGTLETGENGRNLYDYKYWASFGSGLSGEMTQNCVQTQQL